MTLFIIQIFPHENIKGLNKVVLLRFTPYNNPYKICKDYSIKL